MLLVARRQAELELVAREVARRQGVEARVLTVDLATADGPEAVVQATRSIDVGLLVAAAGFGTAGNFIEAKLEQELDMLAVNCRALMELSRYFGQEMVERGSGGRNRRRV